MHHKNERVNRILNPAGCFLLTALLCSCAFYGSSPNEQHTGFFAPVLEIYRGPLNHLYAIRGGQCPMYPTCSEYSRQVIAKHGLAIGWIMATDRLLRCGRDETRLAPLILVDGQLKSYDPVVENDFWWFHQHPRLSPLPLDPSPAAGAIRANGPAIGGGPDKVFDLSQISN